MVMRITAIVGIIALSAAVAAAQTAPAPAKTPATQSSAGGSAAVKQVADSYVKAVLAGDPKAVVALYAEDAVEMPPNQPLLKGRAAIQSYYEQVLGSGRKVMSFTLDHIESHTSGDTAFDAGTYKQSMQGETGAATPASDTGKYVVILKRAGAGWKIAYAIYNSDNPPQAGR
jgi:uncharacterized protein (TIGR02246 family)